MTTSCNWGAAPAKRWTLALLQLGLMAMLWLVGPFDHMCRRLQLRAEGTDMATDIGLWLPTTLLLQLFAQENRHSSQPFFSHADCMPE